jgi:hypothetical protein
MMRLYSFDIFAGCGCGRPECKAFRAIETFTLLPDGPASDENVQAAIKAKADECLAVLKHHPLDKFKFRALKIYRAPDENDAKGNDDWPLVGCALDPARLYVGADARAVLDGLVGRARGAKAN